MCAVSEALLAAKSRQLTEYMYMQQPKERHGLACMPCQVNQNHLLDTMHRYVCKYSRDCTCGFKIQLYRSVGLAFIKTHFLHRSDMIGQALL